MHITNTITHLACIMDGNRRWAKKQSLMPWLGHNQGAKTVDMLILFCLEHRIKILSLYTFSLENFQRSAQEVQYLFQIIIDQAEKALPHLLKQGVKIVFVGDQTYFPEHVKPTIELIQTMTQACNNLLVNILFCYGGRQEITHAAKKIAQEVQDGTLTINTITPAIFERYLWNSGIPDPELIIRTGGVKRLSNFLLYQASYSELYFSDSLWPDLTKQELAHILQEFLLRQRNFGA